MDSRYNHQDFEDKIYKLWDKSGGFSPTDDPKAKSFCIIMPPPNANDPLHVGHAMFVTIEDVLIRYHRMKGDATLWVPGTDHAGIETQFVFEKKLKKDNKSRFDFDRETLYQKIWDYVQENSGVAVDQMKKLGASADWGRFKFTLDPGIVEIVLSTFKKLHDDGLLYRDMRLVNYCTQCGTGFSELEVKHVVKQDSFIHIKYGDFVIGTVRPETKFRDTALAVNPKDKRYKGSIGKTYEIQGLLGPLTMKVVADEEVDPAFGTGMMKVTPAHDFHDFELGKKYDLPVNPIIDFHGKMDFSWFINDPQFSTLPEKYQERARKYHGLHVSKARPLMIEHLKEDGLLLKEDTSYEHTVSVCYRCGSLLEPLPLPQFYIKVAPLTKPVLEALEKGKVKVYGAGHDKILKHWLANLKDWNISRQIVWGIRLPIWYSLEENPTLQVTFLTADEKRVIFSGEGVLKENRFAEAEAGLQELRAPVGAKYVISNSSPGANFLQETDTFDTWFSSGQWPYVTLLAQRTSEELKMENGELKQTNDFERFYPTQVMETAYDILTMWVMRMLMMGLYVTGTVPFEKVYLHGLIRDQKGQKMSKSKGNVINPLTVVDQYGADALRMALVIRSTPGLDKGVGDGDFRAMRNFTNKIWNASRFIMMNREKDKNSKVTKRQKDKEFYAYLEKVVKNVTKQLNDLRVGLAAEHIYSEFWHWFCDECIESNKQQETSNKALLDGLITFLKLLHPFVPFVTEAVWQELKQAGVVVDHQELLMTSTWPGVGVNQSIS